MSDSTTRRWLAIARIAVGALFLYNAYPKVNSAFLLRFKQDVVLAIQGNPFPWFKTVLSQVVLPNEQVFAILLLLSEIAVGAALVVGFLTGLMSMLGFVLSVAYLLSASHLSPASSASFPPIGSAPNLFALALLAVIFFTRAGRVWGLDARLASSRSLFW